MSQNKAIWGHIPLEVYDDTIKTEKACQGLTGKAQAFISEWGEELLMGAFTIILTMRGLQ